MPLKDWEYSGLRVYDAWEDAGGKWVIQDLAPEDEHTAIQILVEHLLKDEPMCAIQNLYYDEESVSSMTKYWQKSLDQKLGIGCYTEVDGEKTLVALNLCVIDTLEGDLEYEVKGRAWQEVYKSKKYIQLKCNPFKYLEVDRILQSCGLAVRREYRGHDLATKILNAREQLCVSLGIKATATVASSPASQRVAAKVGFETIAEATWKELADLGLKFPRDETKVLKSMVKKYRI